jgi:hypothetical protein
MWVHLYIYIYIYVSEMSWDDLSKNEMEWPDLRKITEYRRTVYGIVKEVILSGNWSFPIKMNDPAWALIMGFEHERIHLETSSVLMRELPAHLVTRPAQVALLKFAEHFQQVHFGLNLQWNLAYADL